MTTKRLSGKASMFAYTSKLPNFRKGALALTAAAAISISALFPQAASALSVDQCKGLSGIVTEYVKAQPKGTFSKNFFDSVKGYMAPDGKTLTCSGPGKIAIFSLSDFAGWTDIENGAKAIGINVMREVDIDLLPGSDPRLPGLVAQRDRALGWQAAITPQ